VAVRAAQLDGIAELVRRRSEVELEFRGRLMALWESTPMAEQRYVADELAVVLAESSRTTQRWVEDAVGMSCYPEVLDLVTSGTWTVRHADAVMDELTGLDRAQRRAVLDLVLAQRGARTPHELRKAARAAVYVVDPEAAEKAAAKAKSDRRVTLHDERDGAGSLVMTGAKAAVAAAMAGLDALCGVAQPGEVRTLLQRRFDTLMDLITGRQTAAGGSVMLLVSLATLQGESQEPGLIPGVGHVTAAEAREVVADAAEIRRVVVDGNGELVSADSTVARPEPAADTTQLRGALLSDVLLSDAVEPEAVTEQAEADAADDLAHTVSDEQWLAAQHDAVCDPAAAARAAAQEWATYNDPCPALPGEAAWEAGQAHLRAILATLQQQQATVPGRRVGDAHVKVEADGTVRVHWTGEPDDPDDPEPPDDGGSGPPGPPTQPLPAGWVDDRHAARVRDAGLDLPTDPREAAREARLRRLRRQIPSWVTASLSDEESALLQPPSVAPAPTPNDLDWFSTHPDRGLAHRLIADSTPVADRAPAPVGGWPAPAPAATAWSPEALQQLTRKLVATPPAQPPADSSGYPFRGALRRHIQLRDQTCRFPSCPRLARHCETDHRVEWPLGPTSVWNGLTECDPHHDAKHAVFTLNRLPDGTHRWTLRTGHYADVPPRPLLRGW
jgi:hypothetical protein